GLESGVASTPEKIAHYVASCRAKADALERLIADLFAYTRLEFLEQQPQCEPLELGSLLRQAIDGVGPLAASRGVALMTEAPDEPCALVGDSHLLARAVDNLLDNALRHTPADGCIRVSWRCEGATLRFSVE